MDTASLNALSLVAHVIKNNANEFTPQWFVSVVWVTWRPVKDVPFSPKVNPLLEKLRKKTEGSRLTRFSLKTAVKRGMIPYWRVMWSKLYYIFSLYMSCMWFNFVFFIFECIMASLCFYAFITLPVRARRSIVISTSVCLSFCLCVCLSVREHIPGAPRAIFYQFFVHTVYGCGSVFLQQGDEIPRGRGNFEGPLPHWKCIVMRSLQRGTIQYRTWMGWWDHGSAQRGRIVIYDCLVYGCRVHLINYLFAYLFAFSITSLFSVSANAPPCRLSLVFLLILFPFFFPFPNSFLESTDKPSPARFRLILNQSIHYFLKLVHRLHEQKIKSLNTSMTAAIES